MGDGERLARAFLLFHAAAHFDEVSGRKLKRGEPLAYGRGGASEVATGDARLHGHSAVSAFPANQQ